MERRVNIFSLSWFLCPALILALSGMPANGQSPESVFEHSNNGTGFTVAPYISLSAAPTSVAVGDLNGDGRPDLVITTKNSSSVTVFLNNGKGGFGAGAEYQVGTSPGNAVLADLNGDGKLDLAITDGATGAVDVLLGNGDGTFGKPASYGAISSPVSLAVGNFQGKGRIDLAVASATGVVDLLNDGTGHFQGARNVAIVSEPLSVTAADLTGSGHDDLILANQDGTASILLGDGSGGFHSATAIPVGTGPLSTVVSGDFTGNGEADLAVAQANSNTVNILLGHGDGSFQPGVPYTVGNGPASLIATDLNGDGKLDLIAINQAANTFSVLLGNGDGTFRPSLDFVAGNSPLAVAAGDFNGDGHPDLAILNSSDGTVSMPLGRGDGTLVAARSYKAGLESNAIAAGDLNGDGRTDLVVTNRCGNDSTCSSPGTATVFLANPDGTYRAASTISLGRSPVAVSLADLTGNKKLDLLALNRGDMTLVAMPGNGDGTFGKEQVYNLSGSPRALFVGDFNGDGHPDVAIATDCGQSLCTQPGNVEIWLGRGDGSLVAAENYAVGYSPVSMAAGDLRGTGHLDLLVANACGDDSSCKSNGTATLLAGDGTGKFTASGEIDLGKSPSSIALGSLSNSGLDLVVAQKGSNQLAVMHANGNGGFGAPVNYPVGSAPSALAIGDFNADGLQDVAVANFQSSTLSVLHGTGSGTLQPAVTYAVGTGPEALVTVPGKNGKSGLITADGNSGATPMGTGITALGGSDPGMGTPTFTFTPTSIVSTVDAATSIQVTVGGGSGPASDTSTVTFVWLDSGGNSTALADCGGASGLTLNSNASATCVTQLLPADAAGVEVQFSGDTNYAATTSQEITATIAPAATSASIAASSSTSIVNQAVTFTATVSPSPAPATVSDAIPMTGTATFSVDGTAVVGCTDVPIGASWNQTTGTATFTCTLPGTVANTMGLTFGTHAVTAMYNGGPANGDANYLSSLVSPAQSENVNTAALSTTMVTSNASTGATIDQAVTFTATVAPSASLQDVANMVPISGTVAFKVNGNALSCNPVTVVYNATTGQATASCAAGLLAVGSDSVTATFTPSGTYAQDYSGSDNTASPFAQTVNAATTGTVVTSTPNPSTVNQQVIFTATVTPAIGTPALSPISSWQAMTGTVAFSDGSNTLGTCSSQAISSFTAQGTVTATCTVQGMTATTTTNTHSITAKYTPSTGDTNYGGSTTASGYTQTVNAETPTMTTMTSTANPSTVDGSVTFSTTLKAPTGATVKMTGNVTFYSDSVAISACTPVTVDTATSVTATCTTSALDASAAGHNITATYSGDSDYNTVSTSLTQKVNVAGTSTSVSTSGSPSNVNSSVTFTATVTVPANAAVEPSGSVTFTDNGNPITVTSGCGTTGVVPFNASNWNQTTGKITYACATSALAGGSHAILATYNNLNGSDSNYSSTTGNVTQSVKAIASSITLQNTSTPVDNPSTVDEPVTLTATVTPTGPVALTGPVTFTDTTVGGTPAGCTVSWTPSTGLATCTTTSLTLGTHKITATYPTDSSYTTSSSTLTQTVNQGSTTLMVSSGTNPVAVNAPVTLTATITPSNSGTILLNGNVTFTAKNGNTTTTLCTNAGVSSSNDQAQCPTSFSASGSYTITATYANDTNFTGSSNSNTLTQSVTTASTSLALASSSPCTSSTCTNAPTVNNATPVTFTASITENPSGSGKLTGTVVFTDNSTPISSCGGSNGVSPNSLGIAPCTETGIMAGTHSIKAVYGNDSSFTGSNNTITQYVAQGSTSVSVGTSGTPSTVGAQVTFTATITPTPSGTVLLGGTVNFTDAPPGSTTPATICSNVGLIVSGSITTATCKTNTLTVTASNTSHTITATYGSDSNFSGNSGTVAQQVSSASAPMSMISSVPNSTVNVPVTFTSQVSLATTQAAPAGAVNFQDNGKAITDVNGNAICGAVKYSASSSGAGSTLYSFVCLDSTLAAGNHNITATYSGDSNLSITQGNVAQSVSQAQTMTTLTSSPNPAFPATGNPNGYEDKVTLTATVVPVLPTGASALSVPLSSLGTVAFSVNGTTLAACSAVQPVIQPNGSGVATCPTTTATGFVDGSNAIVATYSNDLNYAISTGNFFETIEDYSATVSGVPSTKLGLEVSQGYTNTTDPYPQLSQAGTLITPAVTLSALSGYSGSLTIACVSVTSKGTATPGAPACTSTPATVSFANGAATTQQVSLTIDATGSSVMPGTYTFTLTATDSNGLVRTATFPVSVRSVSTPLYVVSGATTGNSGNVTFVLPGAVTLSSLSCPDVVGTGITGEENPSTVGIACSISPSTLGSSTSTSTQSVTATVTVTTNNTIAAGPTQNTGLLVAGVLGIPFFGLMGVLRRKNKKARSVFFRLMALFALGIAALQAMGCGGSFHTTTTRTSGGTTPPGAYYLLVEGTGSDGNTYSAVLQLDVTL